MHRHLWTKRSDFFGKLVTRLLPQAVCPLDEAGTYCRKKPLDFFWPEFLRQGEWREVCFEKNLV
jgi:hypothetical protein